MLVVALALTVTAGAAVLVPFTRSDVLFFAPLLVASLLYIEVSTPIERIREHAGTPHIELNSVWMFAGVLLLHPALAAAVIAGTYLYRWLRVRRHVVHRQVFSAAGLILAGHAAATLFATAGGYRALSYLERDLGAFGLVVAAAAVYFVVQTGLVAGAIALTSTAPCLSTVLAKPGDLALEMTATLLGAVMAWAFTDWPQMALVVAAATLMLHRNVLIRQFRDQARADPKTGLLNARAWDQTARRHTSRLRAHGPQAALLMIDLDHFKQVNDEHGHLAGDEVLAAVARLIAAEVRISDVVGRFGGEEFVVLLPDIEPAEAVHVAERIRRRIGDLALPVTSRAAPSAMLRGRTASIGVAVHPQHGPTLDRLLRAADGALYDAKAAGRDQVQVAPVVAGRP